MTRNKIQPLAKPKSRTAPARLGACKGHLGGANAGSRVCRSHSSTDSLTNRTKNRLHLRSGPYRSAPPVVLRHRPDDQGAACDTLKLRASRFVGAWLLRTAACLSVHDRAALRQGRRGARNRRQRPALRSPALGGGVRPQGRLRRRARHGALLHQASRPRALPGVLIRW
jgi:hypothetical protein